VSGGAFEEASGKIRELFFEFFLHKKVFFCLKKIFVGLF